MHSHQGAITPEGYKKILGIRKTKKLNTGCLILTSGGKRDEIFLEQNNCIFNNWNFHNCCTCPCLGSIQARNPNKY